MRVVEQLIGRWYLVVVAAVIAVVAGGSSIYHFSGGHLTRKQTVYYVGSGELLLDSDPSTLTSIAPASGQTSLSGRAPLIATYANQPAVRDAIAKRLGIKPKKITLQSASAKVGDANNSAGKNALSGTGKYSVIIHGSGNSPTLQISTQAPSVKKAKALANATIVEIQHAITKLRNSEATSTSSPSTSTTSTTTTTTSTSSTTPANTTTGKGKAAAEAAAQAAHNKRVAAKRAALRASRRHSKEVRAIILRRLGGINGGAVIDQPTKSKALAIAIGVFIALLIVILVLDRARSARREARKVPVAPERTAQPGE